MRFAFCSKKNIKKYYLFAAIFLPLLIILPLSCWSSLDDMHDSSENNVYSAGEKVMYSADGVSFKMAFVPGGKTFPTGTDDSGIATVDNAYWIAEMEVTNALFAKVLQWALDNGKIVESAGVHNEVNADTIKYGTRELVDLNADVTYRKISFNPVTHSFSIESGYENYPVAFVCWYGAIMFCNWLTEMIDGNLKNVVYSGIPADGSIWQHASTVENANKKGFRLPSKEEWECAARWVGKSAGGRTDLVSQNVSGGSSSLTKGYFWTPGNYASGATTYYDDVTDAPNYKGKLANDLVAVYKEYYDGSSWIDNGTSNCAEAGSRCSNALGIYDMSGNMWEWCFTAFDSANFYTLSGSWHASAVSLQVGFVSMGPPDHESISVGFRFLRTE